MVSLRLGTPDDADAFCALSNSLYARKVTPAYYRWQFFDGPFRPALATAWEGERMVGAYGVHALAADARGPGRAMMLDIMVAADVQGRGLMRDLGGAAAEFARGAGAEVLCVVANERARRAHERHFGWTVWETFTDWRSDDADPPAEPSAWTETAAPDISLDAREPAAFYPRDPGYLQWRTAQSPRYAYAWIGDGGDFSVVKSFRDPQTGELFGDVVGCFPADEDGYETALSGSAGWFAARGARSVVAGPSTPSRRAAAKRAGFRSSGRERYVCGPGERPAGFGWSMLDIDIY